MKIVIELNTKTKKKKKYRVSIKPNNPQLGKIVLYEDDLFIDELWLKAEKICGSTKYKEITPEFDELDAELDKILFNN